LGVFKVITLLALRILDLLTLAAYASLSSQNQQGFYVKDKIFLFSHEKPKEKP
jgi:hypothetical protein